ncbi:MAG TPA: GlmL-related ornithine degradation protein [Bacillota bacterium]|nr:GlmL-related ornithine degradation protein [Bacillota bacterium]
MKIDALVAEIGSTTTVISAFDKLDCNPVFLGQGFAPTTVLEGDVNLGLTNAIIDLKQKLGILELEAKETFACSSAAGGLKMSVHGLVYDMTVKAAREAALGAGANLKLVSAGMLNDEDINYITNSNLNIIMIAGGVDYGETATAIANATIIAGLHLSIPVIYAGNIQNQQTIANIFVKEGQSDYLFLTKNVYPRIDELETDEARKIIQSVFEKHIIKAPGMEKVREMISENIIPTPGAVMDAALLMYAEIGDLVTFDIGGATTDVHSVTNGSERNEKIMLGPEPFAKRTVEGDLGVYVNHDNIIKMIGKEKLASDLGISISQLESMLAGYLAIPVKSHYDMVMRLAKEALKYGLERHAGKYISLYGASGKTTMAEGKDLSAIKYVIGTGGVLAKLDGKNIISTVLLQASDTMMKPNPDAKILIDKDYIMAACGVLSHKHPSAATTLLKKSLGIG